MTQAQRTEELETGIAQAFAELDKADGTRIGLQEAIDSAQSIMREAYGTALDQDSLAYSESDDETDEDEGQEGDE